MAYFNPAYESDSDRKGEARVAVILGEVWKCELLPLPRFSLVDYMAVKDGVVWAFVEIKRRKVSHDHYPTYMLSAKKVNGVVDMANRLRIEAKIGVEFTDGIFWIDAHDMSRGALHYSGRDDRPWDEDAMEKTYHIPHEQLRRHDVS